MADALGVLVGLAITAGGLLGVRHAEAISRFEERLDALGSTRDLGAVEPSRFSVASTKVLAGCLAAAGAFVTLLALLG
ncbi:MULTISPECIES: hypothetical protein [Halorussus]|uniref:hypothetical protein n=1 Tax=Halorussus TaxID=1070314 RepID=UPI00209F4755|nr:hypothetical protein [Halorussus vallis]USZ78211.1 hypothetical protein NGM07_21375 [Halorussus vallis]